MTNKFERDTFGSLILPSTLKQLPKEACYDGIANIKKSGIVIKYEEEQLKEILRCSSDINYFAEKYVWIIDPNKGKSVIELRDYQKKLLEHVQINRFTILLASRQIGKSLTVAIYLLHYILFNEDKKVAILANKAAISKEIFSRLRLAYERLPYWMQVGVVEFQKTSFTLENGSQAFSAATTPEGLRGISAQAILLDEFAFCRRSIADEFFASMYPTVSAAKDSKIIVVSTPNGMNHFHEMWQKAEKKKSDFKTFRVDWWEVPGRDEEWKEETIKNIGQIKFNQEFGNSFIGSSKTLIKPSVLELLESSDPIDIVDNHFKIYEQPIAGNTYAMGVDSAKGTGGDYSVIQVIDITAFPFRQVAVYRNNEISTYKFADVVHEIAMKYNDSYIMCENNDVGQAVVNKLWHDLEYENLVNYTATKAGRADIGIRATKKTKPMGCDLLQEFFEDFLIEIFDLDTIYELSKFEETSTGIFKAEDGEHDDTVMALLWALFIIKTNYIDREDDIRASRDENDEEQYDDEPLAPIIIDGAGEEDGNFLFHN